MSSAAEKLLVSDHGEIDVLIANAFAAVGSGDVLDALAVLDRLWARLAVHIRAEHLHLFPALLSGSGTRPLLEKVAGDPSLENVIADLRSDHNFFMRELAALVADTRKMKIERQEEFSSLCGEITGRLEVLSKRLISHNDREETGIYPMVAQVLSTEEAEELQRRMRYELENMPPRFAESE